MKRLIVIAACLALAAISPIRAAAPNTLNMAGLFPPGAILFACSPDMKSLLAKVKSNPVSKRYIGSAASESFADSKLYLKLADRFEAIENMSGFGFGLDNLNAIAGGASAFALYNIGSLEFIFVTDMSAQSVAETSLWIERERFEQRKMDDTIYYVASDESGATFAFAPVKGKLLVSNSLERFESSLGSILGKQSPNLGGEDWFKAAVPAQFEAGDFTVVIDQERMNDDSYFKTYWLHGNARDFAWIKSTLLNLFIAGDAVEEKRFYTVSEEIENTTSTAGVADIALLRKDALWLDAAPVAAPEAPARAITEWIVGDLRDDHAKFTADIASLLEPGKPVAMATTAAMGGAGKRLVAIRLADPNAVDMAALKKLIADRWSSGVGVGGLVSASFNRGGDGIETIRLPFMDGVATALILKGNVLILSNDETFVREYLASPAAPGITATDNMFLMIDVAKSVDHIAATHRMLSRRSNWEYVDSETFFSESAPSILFAASGVKAVTAKGKRIGNAQTFEARYELAK